MNPEIPAGFAVLCDLQGIVARVLRDNLALGERIAPGQTLTRLVDRGSLSKALSFLVEIKAQGATFDWEMNVAVGETMSDEGQSTLTLHFTGGVMAETLLIAGAASSQSALQLYAELLRLTHAPAARLRAAVQERVEAEHTQAEVGHGLYDDISRLNNELVNLQRELAKTNAQLEQRVAARTADLTQSNAALTQALCVQSGFLAAVSHELRTPLAAVLGLAETLQLGIYGPLTECQQKPVAMLLSSGQRLLALVTDVLDYTALEAGAVSLRRADTPVAEICQASLQAVQGVAATRQIRLTCQIAGALATVPADRQRLEQMLVKLLENAIKFTPEGGAVGLDVTGDVGRREVHFTVWDTGIGLAPEDQAGLFEPFTQVDSRLARNYEGAGLGLALVRRLVELHGGQVKAESDGPGKGSRFTVKLPWEAPADTARS